MPKMKKGIHHCTKLSKKMVRLLLRKVADVNADNYLGEIAIYSLDPSRQWTIIMVKGFSMLDVENLPISLVFKALLRNNPALEKLSDRTEANEKHQVLWISYMLLCIKDVGKHSKIVVQKSRFYCSI